MRCFVHILLILTTCALNTAHAQKLLAWADLCQGYGSGLPLVIIDGVPIELDSMLNPADGSHVITIKTGDKTSIIKPEDIERIDVLKLAAGTLGHNPDRCTILIATKAKNPGGWKTCSRGHKDRRAGPCPVCRPGRKK